MCVFKRERDITKNESFYASGLMRAGLEAMETAPGATRSKKETLTRAHEAKLEPWPDLIE